MEDSRAVLTAKRKVAALLELEKEAAKDGVFIFTTPPELDFANLKLTELPGDISQLIYVQKLLLENNSLTSLPESIGQLHMLEWLVVENNLLTSLPPSIFSGLEKLKWLVLSSNKITSIPPQISQLASLHTLQLDDNLLETLPPEIGDIVHLRTLSVQNNKLTCLPIELSKLVNLKELHVRGNPLRTPPKSIIARGARDILGFLKDLESGVEPSNRCKLMFVGQENVGKTTLMNRLIGKGRGNSVFFGKPLSRNISTDGVDLNQWVSEREDEDGTKQRINFSIWDFAGQEIYYTTHQFFLTEKAIYVLVWDMRQPLANSRVHHWLNSIHSSTTGTGTGTGPKTGNVKTEVPIVLVGTHLDNPSVVQAYPDLDDTREKLAIQLGKSVKHITFVSSISGEGIKELRRELHLIANKLQFVHDDVPAPYTSLESLVFEERKGKDPPIITWKQLESLGHLCNIRSEDVLERAVAYLHQMGSILYFNENASKVKQKEKEKERTGLANMVILNPQWLTTFMASVITTKHSYAKSGSINKSQLAQIWRPPTYPVKLHSELISLLQLFDVAFQMPEGQILLIPSLLPTERPSLESEWPATPRPDTFRLTRNYKFEFIPNGLFSRISVRLLHFTEVIVQWRTGILIRHKGELALVEYIVPLNEISISARGRDKLPSEVLHIVCETADSIISRWFSINLNITVHCTHCLTERTPSPSKFSMLDCQRAAAKGEKTLRCNDKDVSLELLVPDLVLADIKSSSVDFEKDIKIVRQIGKGSFGIIYLATLRDTEQVAVKKIVIPPALEDDDSMITYFEEFRREVWLMSGLNHPNIVNLLGFSLQPLSIVMENVPCGSLESLLGGNKSLVTWEHKIRIAVDVALGMNFLHSLSPPVLHRDLKSPNVLLASLDPRSKTPVAKVADFGSSLRLFAQAVKDRVVDQARWLAPEIFRKEATTLKSDVYSYGIILWELLTLSVPFSEYPFARWGSQLEDAILATDIRPTIPPDAPPNYKSLIEICWATDPNVRPTFGQILVALEQLKAELAPDLDISITEFGNNSKGAPMKDDLQVPSVVANWQTARFGHNTIDSLRSPVQSTTTNHSSGGSFYALGSSRSIPINSTSTASSSFSRYSTSASPTSSVLIPVSLSASGAPPSYTLMSQSSVSLSSLSFSSSEASSSTSTQPILVQSVSLPSIPLSSSLPLPSFVPLSQSNSFLPSSPSFLRTPTTPPRPRHAGLGEHRDKNV